MGIVRIRWNVAGYPNWRRVQYRKQELITSHTSFRVYKLNNKSVYQALILRLFTKVKTLQVNFTSAEQSMTL